MDKQKQLVKLKKQVTKLEEEIKSKPVIQEIPAVKLEWGKTADEEMDWKEAKKWCKKQGKDWRLPTRVELCQAYENKINGFVASYYWSSTECGTGDAWRQGFSDGSQYYNYKTTSYYVRCVRSL